MNESYQDYVVKSYFLNVGLGDSSLHLLIANLNGAPPKVKAAVLIDGGMNAAAPVLEDALEAIRQEIDFHLTAIVVSHWDEDHAKGVVRFLREDYQRVSKGQPSKWLKAGAVFYCPLTGLHSYETGGAMRVTDKPNTPTPTGYELQFKDKDTKDAGWSRYCDARMSTYTLGWNLFTNGHYVETKQELKNPVTWPVSLQDIYDTCPLLKGMEMPIFLVYGIDDNSFSGDVWRKPTHGWNIITGSAWKNEASIMAVILWPGPNVQLGPRISLYTGGDVPQKHEDDMMKWLGGGAKKIHFKLDVIKASHHGSHYSTPETMFTHSLQFMIVSAEAEYGHPSFAVVHCFYALSAELTRRKEKPPRLMCMRYPYWLIREADDMKEIDCDPGTVISWSPSAIAIQELMEALDIANPHLMPKMAAYLGEIYPTALAVAKTWRKFVETVKQFEMHTTVYKNHPLTAAHEEASGPTDTGAMWFRKTVAEVQGVVGSKWAAHAEPLNDNVRGVRWIRLEAKGSDGIIGQQVENLGNDDVAHKMQQGGQIWRTGPDFKWAWNKGDKLAKQLTDRENHLFSQDMLDFLDKSHATSLSLPLEADSRAQPLSPSLEAQILSFFSRDLQSTRRHLETNFDEALSPTESPCTQWFADCVGADMDSQASLRLKGTCVPNDSSINLSQADFSLQLQTNNPGESSPPSLVFTTEKDVRLSQFGPEAGNQQSELGYDSPLRGVVLALRTESSRSTSSVNLAQFAQLVGFPVSPEGALKPLLGQVNLRPYTGSRSAIWFLPQYKGRTVVRIAMEVSESDSTKALQEFLGTGLGRLSIKNPIFIGTRIVSNQGYVHNSSSSKLSLQCDVVWDAADKGTPPPFKGQVRFSFTNDGIEAAFRYDGGDTVKLLADLMKWGQSITTSSLSPDEKTQTLLDEDSTSADVIDKLSTVTDNGAVSLRRLSLEFTHSMRPRAFEIDLEVVMFSNVPFLTSLRCRGGTLTLSAELWRQALFGEVSKMELHPFYELTWLGSPLVQSPSYSIPLKKLLHLDDSLQMPQGLPDAITSASFFVSRSSGQTNVFLSAAISCDLSDLPSGDDKPTPPALRLDQVGLSLGLSFPSGKNAPPVTDIVFHAGLMLRLPPGIDQDGPAAADFDDDVKIIFRITYLKTGSAYQWSASAGVQNLKMANLCQFFAQDGSSHAILDIMASINIKSANITHVSDQGGESSLSVLGTLILGATEGQGGLQLDLQYSHVKDKWMLEATASPADKERTLKVVDLLRGLVNDVTELPQLVQNLEIPQNELKVTLRCFKDKDVKTNKTNVVFSLTIDIGDLQISLVQIRSTVVAKAMALARANKSFETVAADTGPARVLRIALAKLPDLPRVPITGTVHSPFDQLGIVWANRDVTTEELSCINTTLIPSAPILSGMHKEVIEPLAQGFHFQLAVFDGGSLKLVLDHVIGKHEEKKKQNLSTQPISRKEGESKAPRPLMVADSSGKTVAPLVRQSGPLSVSSIGLSVSGQSMSSLSVTLDATLQMGSFGFALLGFAFTIDLHGITSLDGLKKLPFDVSVKGMSLSYKKPPTQLAGLFLTFDEKNEAGFMGAITVSIDDWSAMAGGMYSEGKSPDHLKSIFVFGILRGPVFSIGSLDIDGLTGGIGYNSRLSLPTISQVAEFPFIAANNALGPPRPLTTELATLRGADGRPGWITMARDEMWFVAGAGMKAFQTVDAQIVIALTPSEDPRFVILAQATAVFPKSNATSAATPPKQLLLIDVVLRAEVDPFHGSLSVAGDLTPRSFILDPSCQLLGGFAFQLYVEGSPYAGDFAFTVGGYSRKYTPPDRYPAAPARVGINWQYDSHIRISGEAYFAITPQLAMGGGRLDLLVDLGWVRAAFSAWADFFMHFHPFSFSINVGITISVEVNIPALFFTIHRGPLNYSADLNIHGPPVGGTAHFSFWTWSLVVEFGPGPVQPPPLTWAQFVRMVKNLRAQSDDASDEKQVPDHILSITKGRVPVMDKDQKASLRPDEVLPNVIRANGFEFSVEARVPILSAKIGENPDEPLTHSADVGLFARPMQLEDSIQTSHVKVALKHAASGHPVSLELRRTKTIASPPALWGKYVVGAATEATGSEAMIQHVMGLEVGVSSKPPSTEGLPVIDVVKFNGVDVGSEDDNRIPIPKSDTGEGTVIRKAEEEKVVPRGHAHLLHGPPPEFNSAAVKEKRKRIVQLWRTFQPVA